MYRKIVYESDYQFDRKYGELVSSSVYCSPRLDKDISFYQQLRRSEGAGGSSEDTTSQLPLA